MKKIIRLTESDLTRIVKRVIKENNDLCDNGDCKGEFETKLNKALSSLEAEDIGYLYIALINKISDFIETNNMEKY
jgi:hypothetical protein